VVHITDTRAQKVVSYTSARITETVFAHDQWRSKAESRPGPTIKVPPFPPLKFAFKNFKWKFMFRADLKIYGL